MDTNIFLLPAALFPAIPLMMINFGNRYTTLSKLIRKIHDELIDNVVDFKPVTRARQLGQISMLRQRLRLNRATQTLAALGFLTNLIAMYSAFAKFEWFEMIFTIGIAVFGLSIILFAVEIQIATRALDKHIEDLEDL